MHSQAVLSNCATIAPHSAGRYLRHTEELFRILGRLASSAEIARRKQKPCLAVCLFVDGYYDSEDAPMTRFALQFDPCTLSFDRPAGNC
jgi:hypothetical protein